MHSLLYSGAQEATEEGGISARLRPEKILSHIHHYKTGVLFQCTWAIPGVFEDTVSSTALAVQEALYRIGMGCQILDDMVDLNTDRRDNHHNYVLSTIFHEESPYVWRQLESMDPSRSVNDFYREFPELHARMKAKALLSLEGGLHELFFAHHDFLVQPAITFIAERIGVQMATD
ncbi:MAG: polyprenyl synthetase family protein [Desulfofustis sp.]|nr:polyprenyl synthetase family protein [Desulfofustis sp.]